MNKLTKRLRSYISEDTSAIVYSILRICLVLILWSKWASVFRFFHEYSSDFLITAAVFYISSFLMFVGIKSQLMNIVTALTCMWIYYGLGVYGSHSDFVHHHTYLICISIFVLMFTPSGKFFSYDQYALQQKNEKKQQKTNFKAAQWPQLVLAFQVSMVYLWGAYSKLNLLFLSGASLDYIFFDHFLLYTEVLTHPIRLAVYQTMSYMVIASEFFLAFALWFKTTRKTACIIGVLMHGVFYVFLPVSTFSVTILLLYLAFFDSTAIEKNIRNMIN